MLDHRPSRGSVRPAHAFRPTPLLPPLRFRLAFGALLFLALRFPCSAASTSEWVGDGKAKIPKVALKQGAPSPLARRSTVSASSRSDSSIAHLTTLSCSAHAILSRSRGAQ